MKPILVHLITAARPNFTKVVPLNPRPVEAGVDMVEMVQSALRWQRR